MEISTTATHDLKAHAEEITAEQAHRREHGKPGTSNKYLAAMTEETLREHQLYVLRELYRRDAKAQHHAFFTPGK